MPEDWTSGRPERYPPDPIQEDPAFLESGLDAHARLSTPYPEVVNAAGSGQGRHPGGITDGLINQAASLGSPGVDQIRWLRPVRPGDTLSVRAEILEVTPSRSKPDRGAVRVKYEALNQYGEVVMTMTGVQLLGRRPPR